VITGADAVRILIDAVPISIQTVSKSNFAGNGLPYLQALMMYPAIWKVESIAAWETLQDGKGFVPDNRIAAIGLYSLTSASKAIIVSVRQPDGRFFDVEKLPSGEFTATLREQAITDRELPALTIQANLEVTSFVSFPNDVLRLASRLREIAYRKGIKITLRDDRPDSSSQGRVYHF
jgi:hypothetical protein